MDQWMMRFGQLTTETRFPGVYKLKGGGHLIRARAQEPRTKQIKEVRRVLAEEASAARASRVLQDELARVREGVEAPQKTIPTFKEYFGSWLERRINRGKVSSAATRRVYGDIFKNHFYPCFGRMVLGQIRRGDVETWCDEMGRQIRAEDLSPRTANMRLGILKAVLRSAAQDFEIGNPADGVEPFSTAEHPTYTVEEPNSLTAEEVPAFLGACRADWPHLYAVACLGYATGLRPSSLRPLRKGGATPDLVPNPDGSAWLYVRRSHAARHEISATTKQKKHGQILLPAPLVAVLRWHLEQGNEAQRASEFLFPNVNGKLYKLDKLSENWPDIATAAEIKKHITPRSMRRTFQDLCRLAEVRDLVTRSISGHATEAMQHHYSTVQAVEQREAIGKVFDIMEAREAKRSFGGATGGVREQEMAAPASVSDGDRLAG